MAEIVLPQLVEAEAQLAAQEAALSQQLEELQEKIKGVQTVIAMFGGDDNSNGTAATVPVVETVAEPVATAPKARGGRPKKAAAAPKSTAKATSKTSKTATKAKKTATAKTATTKKTAAKTTKRGGKASNWQRYVREDFSKTPLPNIVENILKAQPKNVFKIAEVMAEIFPEDMPKAHFLKARNRISNILSAGARDGEWARGRGGTYSCDKKSLKS